MKTNLPFQRSQGFLKRMRTMRKIINRRRREGRKIIVKNRMR